MIRTKIYTYVSIVYFQLYRFKLMVMRRGGNRGERWGLVVPTRRLIITSHNFILGTDLICKKSWQIILLGILPLFASVYQRLHKQQWFSIRHRPPPPMRISLFAYLKSLILSAVSDHDIFNRHMYKYIYIYMYSHIGILDADLRTNICLAIHHSPYFNPLINSYIYNLRDLQWWGGWAFVRHNLVSLIFMVH